MPPTAEPVAGSATVGAPTSGGPPLSSSSRKRRSRDVETAAPPPKLPRSGKRVPAVAAPSPTVTISRSILECNLCTDMIRYPLRLGCGCVFCTKCMVETKRNSIEFQYHGTDVDSAYPGEMRFRKQECPNCRLVTEPRVGVHLCGEVVGEQDRRMVDLLHPKETAHQCEHCQQSLTMRQYTPHVLRCARLRGIECTMCERPLRTPPKDYRPRTAQHPLEPAGDAQLAADSAVDEDDLHQPLQRMWQFHVDHECKEIQCNRCNWCGTHSKWALHRCMHKLEALMEQCEHTLKGREAQKWGLWAQQSLRHMPMRRARLEYMWQHDADMEPQGGAGAAAASNAPVASSSSSGTA
jgi:hypothetical protein